MARRKPNMLERAATRRRTNDVRKPGKYASVSGAIFSIGRARPVWDMASRSKPGPVKRIR